MGLPELPDKDRVVELLNKTHGPAVPNWTTSEQEEVYIAMRSLAFYGYRTGKVLTEI